MYNLLAVDDETAVLDMLRDAFVWEELGIRSIETASDIHMAKEIIRNRSIDLMLCDIEMPGGNGLELLQWVRQENYPVITLFLTGYANFEYARQALILGSLDYILKPVSFKALREAVEKAVIHADNRRRAVGLLAEDGTGKEARAARNAFWKDILTIEHGGNRGFIGRTAENYGVDCPLDEKYVLTYVAAKRVFEDGPVTDLKECIPAVEDVMGAACRQVILISADGSGGGGNAGVKLSGNRLIVVSDAETSLGQLMEKCRILIELLSFHYHVYVSCYMGEAQKPELLYKQLMMLRFIESEDNSVGKVYQLSHWKRQTAAYRPPDFNLWALLLAEGDGDAVYGKAHEYVLRYKGAYDRSILEMFFHDFLQMIYSVLRQKGIMANSLFGSNEALRMVENALRSPEDMELNLWMICRQAAQLMGGDDGGHVPERVKRYVKSHIFEDFSREDVAEHVHMSPEHLSRLFKRSEGLTLVDYIQEQKIETAKELLKSSQLAVGEIASWLGYKNFAYFSGLFKKYTGVTPLNYRKQ